MIDKQKLQVLLDVLNRAPLTRAEQLITQEIIDHLIEMAELPAPPVGNANGARADGVREGPAGPSRGGYADRVTG